MLKVFKYPVPLKDYVEIDLPRGAQVLHVAPQGGDVMLWALVNPELTDDPELKKVTSLRRFRFAGTGHPINERAENLKYVNTFFSHGGALVFHFFEVLQ